MKEKEGRMRGKEVGLEGFEDRRKGREKGGKEDVGKVARIGGRKEGMTLKEWRKTGS